MTIPFQNVIKSLSNIAQRSPTRNAKTFITTNLERKATGNVRKSIIIMLQNTKPNKKECTYEKKKECHTEYRQEVSYEKKQECKTTYREECKPDYHYGKKCEKIPEEKCHYKNVPKYKNVPEENALKKPFPNATVFQKSIVIHIPYPNAIRFHNNTAKKSISKDVMMYRFKFQ